MAARIVTTHYLYKRPPRKKRKSNRRHPPIAPPNALTRMRGEMVRMENKSSRSWKAVKSAFSP